MIQQNQNFCEDEKQFIATIRLARSYNIGPITFLKLIQKYQTPEDALRAATSIANSKGKIRNIYTQAQAEDEIANTKSKNANIITIFDEAYPEILKTIEDPPILLSYKGDISKLGDRKMIGMVGSRNCSANASNFAFKISKELAENNYVIASGLALGIDAASHSGSLDTEIDFPTVGVIGGGIDHIYPKQNAKLYEQIEGRGVILSENPINTAPKAENFPRRNRIISGLSLGTVIVEAALRSGSLITGRMALEQNRELMCVPGFPLDPRCQGTNKLIQQGATLITSSQDIIYHIRNNTTQQKIDFSYKEDYTTEGEAFQNPTNTSTNLIDLLSHSPISIDQLIEKTTLTPAQVNSILIDHEIAGEVTRHAGNKVSLV